MQPSIQTRNLTKRYDKEIAVDRLDLSVPTGAVYGFLGPNGAGKTTTLKMLLGLVHPSEGEVRLFNQRIDGKNRLPILRQVGSLSESPSFYGHLTARENLEVIRTLRNLPESEIDDVLGIVRLDSTGKKLVGKFSLGMKQRLGIAMALMGKPKLLLLDEPTNGLDPAGIHEMRELIRSLPATYGITVVVSSHLLSEIDQIADYVGVIRHGRLVFEDTLSALHELSSHTIALRTSDNALAAGVLPEARVEEDYLILPILPDEEAAQLCPRLAGQGIAVVRMEERRTSLEDIFLAMTGTEADA